MTSTSNGNNEWTSNTANSGRKTNTINMASVKESMDKAMGITGAIGAALVDYESGMTLATAGGGERLNLDVAAAGNTEVVRAKLRVMNELSIKGGISDVLITLDSEYHLIRPLKATTLFLYLAVDREQGNLALARHKVADIENNLEI